MIRTLGSREPGAWGIILEAKADDLQKHITGPGFSISDAAQNDVPLVATLQWHRIRPLESKPQNCQCQVQK